MDSLSKSHGEVQQLFRDYLEGKSSAQSGVLLHRKYSNFPIQLIHSLYKNLHDDLVWCRSQNESEDEIYKEFKHLTHIMIVNSCNLVDGVSLAENTCMIADRSVLYDEFEDEIFMSHAIASIVYKPSRGKSPLCVGIFPISSMKAILSEIHTMCPSDL